MTDKETAEAMEKMTADLQAEQEASDKFRSEIGDLQLRMASLLAEAVVKIGTRIQSLTPRQAAHEVDTRLVQLRVVGDAGAQLFAVLGPDFQPLPALVDFEEDDDGFFADEDGDDPEDDEAHACGCDSNCACDGACQKGCGCTCDANPLELQEQALPPRSRRGSGSGRPS
jgi:hypothetical protein